jgi:hypothetical protein
MEEGEMITKGKIVTGTFSIIVWIVGLLIFAVPGDIMGATATLKSPKSIKVRIQANQIAERSGAKGQWDSKNLRADITFDVDCGKGWGISKYFLSRNFPGGGGVQSQHVSPSSKPRTLRRQVIKGMILGSMNQLKKACGSEGFGNYNPNLNLTLICTDKDYGGGSSATTRDLRDPDKTTGHKFPINVTVQCSKKTVRATTKPSKWRHTCPKGYHLEGSRVQSAETTRPQSPWCYPEGTDMRKACPFIFTQESEGGDWIEQGTILTYHNGKETERTQVKELTAFTGKILIREIDPETSYTDSLKVILYYEDGSKEVLLPKTEELRETDGNYLITNQGDEVVVDFGIPSRGDFKRAELITDGYYELY